jgi:hypothetical protein
VCGYIFEVFCFIVLFLVGGYFLHRVLHIVTFLEIIRILGLDFCVILGGGLRVLGLVIIWLFSEGVGLFYAILMIGYKIGFIVFFGCILVSFYFYSQFIVNFGCFLLKRVILVVL